MILVDENNAFSGIFFFFSVRNYSLFQFTDELNNSNIRMRSWEIVDVSLFSTWNDANA